MVAPMYPIDGSGKLSTPPQDWMNRSWRLEAANNPLGMRRAVLGTNSRLM